jgi:prophage maintenance system killer protein
MAILFIQPGFRQIPVFPDYPDPGDDSATMVLYSLKNHHDTFMEEITVARIREVHDRIVIAENGDSRILSEANLHMLVFRANLITDPVPRAAFILYALCAYPAFREGNTETALELAGEVLASEGFRFSGRRTEMLALADGILSWTTEPEDIEAWLSCNFEKTGSS